MQKKLVLLLTLAILNLTGFSQTKRIAHHSHSGKDADFSMEGTDNFGLDTHMQHIMDSTRKAEDSVKIASYRDSVNKGRAKKPKVKSSK